MTNSSKINITTEITLEICFPHALTAKYITTIAIIIISMRRSPAPPSPLQLQFVFPCLQQSLQQTQVP